MIMQQMIQDPQIMTTILSVAKWTGYLGVPGFFAILLRHLWIKVDKSISKEDVGELIVHKLAPIIQRQEDIREDQRDIKQNISKILDRLSTR